MEDTRSPSTSSNKSDSTKLQDDYAKDLDSYYLLYFSKDEEHKRKLELKDAVEKAIAEDLETTKDDADSETNSQVDVVTSKPQVEFSNESTALVSVQSAEVVDSRHPSIFDKLPDEALLKIWNYLDPSSIGRIARVCKRFREMSYDLPLWRELSRKRNWDVGVRRSNSTNKGQTRSYYVRKFLSFRRGEKMKEDQKIEERKNRFKQRNRENSARFLKATCFARPWEWISVGCVLAVTILAVLKLDGSLNASWATVMIPLYILLLQIVGAPILYDTLSTCYDYDFDREFEPDDNSRCGPLFFFLAFIVPLQESTRFARLVIYPVITCLLLWLIFMFIKINNVATNFPWIAAFVPLLIICIIFSIVILSIGTFNVFSDEQRIDRIIPVFFIVLLMLFIIFLALKLEGTISWSWFYVMSPLWILKGLFVLIPIVLTMMTIICDRCINVYWLEDRTRWAENPGPFCMTATGFTVLVVAPLLAFEILLAQNLESTVERTFKIIFIPLFILEGFGITGCCIVNIAFLCSD